MSMKWHLPIAPFKVVEQIPKKSGDGFKKPTVLDAKRLCLLPSASSMLDVEGDALVEYRVNEAIFHCAILPYHGGFDEVDENGHPSHKINPEEYAEYQEEIQRRMADKLTAFADQGKEVHAQVAQYFEGKGYPSDESAVAVVETLNVRLNELGVKKVVCEKVIGGPERGFVGTPDMVGLDGNGFVIWIGDLKTVNESPFKKMKTEKALYMKWRMQLAAYSILLEASEPVIDQVLSCRDTHECRLVHHENSERMAQATRYHLRSWLLRKELCPWTDFAENKETLMDEWLKLV